MPAVKNKLGLATGAIPRPAKLITGLVATSEILSFRILPLNQGRNQHGTQPSRDATLGNWAGVCVTKVSAPTKSRSTGPSLMKRIMSSTWVIFILSPNAPPLSCAFVNIDTSP